MTEQAAPRVPLATKVKYLWCGFLFAMTLTVAGYVFLFDAELTQLRAHKRIVEKCLRKNGTIQQDVYGHTVCIKRPRGIRI
jgi:hypothetical protein